MQSEDENWMLAALSLAEDARYRSPPHPWVGCVLIHDKLCVGQGSTQTGAAQLAEHRALQQAGELARGATAYLSLEPSIHHDYLSAGTDALIEAGISRVVVALEDPDPRVSGQGIARLRDAGIEVTVGIGKQAAERQLRPYLHQRIQGRPWVILKSAVSIDGRTAAPDGSSQWISSKEARRDAHDLRGRCQAILVGAGTAVKDSPSLTVRNHQLNAATQPLRVLWDPSGRVPPDAPLLDGSVAPTLVATRKAPNWHREGVSVLVTDCIEELLDSLGGKGVLEVLVEGGPRIHQLLWDAGLVDQIIVYVGAALIGQRGAPLLAADLCRSVDKAPRLTLEGCKQLGDTVRMEYLCSQASWKPVSTRAERTALSPAAPTA